MFCCEERGKRGQACKCSHSRIRAGVEEMGPCWAEASQVTPLPSGTLNAALPTHPLQSKVSPWYDLLPRTGGVPSPCFVGREALRADFPLPHGRPVPHPDPRVLAVSGGLLPSNPAPPTLSRSEISELSLSRPLFSSW